MALVELVGAAYKTVTETNVCLRAQANISPVAALLLA